MHVRLQRNKHFSLVKALRAPKALTQPHSGATQLCPGPEPSMKLSLLAPAVLQGCGSPANCQGRHCSPCWFVQSALSVFHTCMCLVAIHHSLLAGPREMELQQPGCMKLEQEKPPWLEPWATLAPAGLKEAIPCPQRPLYSASLHRPDVLPLFISCGCSADFRYVLITNLFHHLHIGANGWKFNISLTRFNKVSDGSGCAACPNLLPWYNEGACSSCASCWLSFSHSKAPFQSCDYMFLQDIMICFNVEIYPL